MIELAGLVLLSLVAVELAVLLVMASALALQLVCWALNRPGPPIPPARVHGQGKARIGVYMALALALYGPGCGGVQILRDPTFDDGVPGWREFPLRVLADPDLNRDSIRLAARLWNRASGCELLILVDRQPADVTIGTGQTHPQPQPEMLGAAWVGGRGGRLHAEIEIYVHHDTHQTYLIAAHELGHALGLGHDRGRRISIMHPYAGDIDALNHRAVGWGWDKPAFQYMVVTTGDAAALRKAYCHEGR